MYQLYGEADVTKRWTWRWAGHVTRLLADEAAEWKVLKDKLYAEGSLRKQRSGCSATDYDDDVDKEESLSSGLGICYLRWLVLLNLENSIFIKNIGKWDSLYSNYV